MDLKELIAEVDLFCAERDWEQFHNAKDLAIGVSTEASELLEKFRFLSLDQVNAQLQQDQFKEEVADEVADVFYFLLRFSSVTGIDVVEAFKHKMKKNAEKYPVEKARGSNRKYNQLS